MLRGTFGSRQLPWQLSTERNDARADHIDADAEWQNLFVPEESKNA
jgi:hypothetical protein